MNEEDGSAGSKKVGLRSRFVAWWKRKGKKGSLIGASDEVKR